MATESRISEYLDDTAFPATREEIIQMAADNDAPDDILAELSRLPDTIYDSIHEVRALIAAREGY
ncbi:MAG TPA: DUF2795 domain-containing protein [Armatimonadota bacterium]|nr:DUF2795 domain-containing protein [Armatimonadota bacterium]